MNNARVNASISQVVTDFGFMLPSCRFFARLRTYPIYLLPSPKGQKRMGAAGAGRGITNAGAKRRVRFGPFELDCETGELRKYGLRIKLQGQPYQLLEALLEKPGQVVGREELHGRLWSAGRFVDFESGLNSAAKRLRVALGDSAENPRYIETLARNGYRFIAPVEDIIGEHAAGQEVAGTTAALAPAIAPYPAPRNSSLKKYAVGAAVTGAMVLLCTLYFRRPAATEATFRELTFRRGQVSSARFTADGRDVLYTAAWDNGNKQIFLTTPLSPESRPLGFQEANLASVSRLGELALLAADGAMPLAGGNLSRVPMNGGEPSQVDRHVMAADWSSDGKALAIVRAINGMNQLEFPAGRVLYRTSGWLNSVRVSPRNDAIAFIEHPVRHDDGGSVKLIDTDGNHGALSEGWASAAGLAWKPSGKELWFTASRNGSAHSLWAVTRSGKLRLVGQAPGILRLHDIAADGTVLLARESRRLEIAARLHGDTSERDISWLDLSRAQDISADGKLILFDESGEGTRGSFVSYIRRADGQSAVRLGEGRAMALSPDGKSALLLGGEDRRRFRMVPVSGGAGRYLPATGLEYQWGRFFPDGRDLLALANEPGRGLRVYRQPLEGGKPSAITPPTVVRSVAISPDGKRVAMLSADGRLTIYPAQPGEARVMPASEPLAPILWASDGKTILVQHLRTWTEVPARISRMDVATGALTPWKQLAPRDPMGVNAITRILISSDESSYAYSYRRVLSELFVANGWK